MDDLELINPDLLPHGVRLYFTIMGTPDAIALLKARGGTPLYIPMHAEKATVLKNIISHHALVALTNSELAGRTLELPKPDAALKQLRDIAIKEECKISNQTQVALRYKLTRVRVNQIANQGQAENPTLDMFAEAPSE